MGSRAQCLGRGRRVKASGLVVSGVREEFKQGLGRLHAHRGYSRA